MASKARPGAGALEGLALGLLLWRVQLQMFINQTIRSRQSGRIAGTIAGAAVILLAWSWEGFITWLGVQATQRVPVRVDAIHLLSLAFLAYTGVLVFSSLVFSLNALLLNPDLDLLLAAPRSVESVLASRMVVQVLRLFLLSLLFTAPALVLLAIVNANPLIPLAFAMLFLLYPVFVVVIISLMSLLLVRIIPVGRGREVLTLFGVALAIGINLANFLLNPALRDPGFARHPGVTPSLPDIPVASSSWLPSGWAGRSAAAVLGGDWVTAGQWILLLLAASAAIFAAGSVLNGRLYMAGWIQGVPPRRRHATPRVRRSKGALPLLSPVLAAVVIKDWRMRTRDLAQLVRFVMPVVFIFIIFGLRFPRVLGAVRGLGEGPPAAMIGLIPAWILLFSLSISLGLSAVSLEGKSIWVYAASPNSTLRFLQAKCWSTALPTASLVALAALAAEIIIRPGWLWAVTAVLLAVAEAAAVTTLMVGIGAVFARFDWTDARRMMHPVGVFVGMGLFSIISGVSALLLVISIALAAVTRFPLVTTWLAAMTIAVGGVIAIAALGILFGNQHLRGLEVG
ncbi:MAG: type transport system permease protein [Chloroflexota bacterium]|nr:type transport system permease protein [Chloroflexota bacterium]